MQIWIQPNQIISLILTFPQIIHFCSLEYYHLTKTFNSHIKDILFLKIVILFIKATLLTKDILFSKRSLTINLQECSLIFKIFTSMAFIKGNIIILVIICNTTIMGIIKIMNIIKDIMTIIDVNYMISKLPLLHKLFENLKQKIKILDYLQDFYYSCTWNLLNFY